MFLIFQPDAVAYFLRHLSFVTRISHKGVPCNKKHLLLEEPDKIGSDCEISS